MPLQRHISVQNRDRVFVNVVTAQKGTIKLTKSIYDKKLCKAKCTEKHDYFQ